MKLRAVRTSARPLVVLTALAVLALTITGASPVSAASTGSNHTLRVTAPVSALAGEPVTLQIDGAAPHATATVMAIGSLGTFTAKATSNNTLAILPKAFTRAAGRVDVIVRSGDDIATASFELQAGAAVAPVQAVVGARSIVADGTDKTMVVAVPVDRFGNAIAEGSLVRFSRLALSGTIEWSLVPVDSLLAWREFGSGTKAGRDFVWADAGGAVGHTVDGNRVDLTEVAGVPQTFTVIALNQANELWADGQSLVPVQTTVLADRYGNIEPDGTEVIVHWVGPDGDGQATAITVAGVARLSLLSPYRPGKLQLTATSRGAITVPTLTLTFVSPVTAIPQQATQNSGGLTLAIGPIERNDGSQIADGTAVTATLTDAQGTRTTVNGTLANGHVTLALARRAIPKPATVSTTILGYTSTVTVQ